jgi:hypothetical protein
MHLSHNLLTLLFTLLIITPTFGQTIGSPPSSLGLDPFYKKYLNANGIPIISSSKVPDEALFQVKKTIEHLVSKCDAALEKFIENGGRVGIMAQTEQTLDMPEHSDLQTAFPGTNWNTRARGLGATLARPLSSCAEENVLCYNTDNYFAEDILIHEFAHSFHFLGLNFIGVDFDNRLKTIYNKALADGLWANTYAGSDYAEYWAEGVQSWFNLNTEVPTVNGVHNYINTRSELENYDPRLYNLIAEFFTDSDYNPSCHNIINNYTEDVSPDDNGDKVAIDPNAFYRLATMYTGPEMPMQIGADNSSLNMSAKKTDKRQYWQFKLQDNGYYRISCQYLGASYSLDISPDSKMPHLAKTGDYSGQYWQLIPAADRKWFRFVSMFTGQDLCLDISPIDGKPVIMGNRGDYSGQYWQLIRVD